MDLKNKSQLKGQNKMTNELIKQPKFEVDYKAVEDRIENAVKGYRNIVVTEENLPEIAKAKASIIKLLESINKERIAIDKEWRKPLDELKKNYDSKIKIGNEVVYYLKTELDVFEDERKKKREKDIEKIWKEFDIKLFSLKDLFDNTWYNKGCDFEKETRNKFDRIQKDLALLEESDPTLKTLAIDNYKQTQDITQALSYATRLHKQIVENESKEDKVKVPTEQKIVPQALNEPTMGTGIRKIIIKSYIDYELVIEYLENEHIEFELE